MDRLAIERERKKKRKKKKERSHLAKVGNGDTAGKGNAAATRPSFAQGVEARSKRENYGFFSSSFL